MGFKDYVKNSEENKVKNETKKVEELYNKYKDKSEDELTAELFNQVNKQKSDGNFNINQLEEISKKVSPFLSNEQNLKIQELLNKMKND